MSETQLRVATTADTADLHATAPTLLLEIQSLLGTLSNTATVNTDRGRRPFRPDPDWALRLGELAYGVYLLADQTGVDLEQAVAQTAQQLEHRGQQAQARADNGWPFES